MRDDESHLVKGVSIDVYKRQLYVLESLLLGGLLIRANGVTHHGGEVGGDVDGVVRLSLIHISSHTETRSHARFRSDRWRISQNPWL